MATIGQQLLNPEVGCRRIDDRDANISFLGGGWLPGSESGFYNTTYNQSNVIGASIRFNFTGKSLAIIGMRMSDKTTSADIYIDGFKVATINQYGDRANQILEYAAYNLTDKEHYVSIVNNTNGQLYLDAIDIDSTGAINSYDPWVNKTKSATSSMITGDRIPFRYQATSNAFGVIDQLGTATGSEIPVASSASPNGKAYFIMVGYDHKGRKKLIPDRNLQHSISLDALNTAGIASGSGLPIIIDGKDGYTLRLPSGGITGTVNGASTDKDNEWDKIIMESTLNTTVAAGNNEIWNSANIYSWCSTVSTSGNKVVRGYYSLGTWSHTSSTDTNNQIGFRPVLLVESKNSFYIILKDNKAYSYTDSTLIEVSSDWGSLTNEEKRALFTSSNFPSVSSLELLGTFELLAFSPDNINQSALIGNTPFKTTLPSIAPVVTATPKPQFVYASGDIDLSGCSNIDWIHINNSIANSVTGNSKLKYVFSVDKGVTWKTYKNGAFITILDTANPVDGQLVSGVFKPSETAISTLLADGMNKASFDTVPWNDITLALNNKLIRFATIFDLDKTTDNCYNDNLAYQYDGLSVWKQAVNGVDYEVRYVSPSKLQVKFLTGGYKVKVNY